MNKTLLKLASIFFTIIFSIQTYSQNTKIMSFNIRYDNPNDGENSWNTRKKELVNLIAHYYPDILGIQEGLYNQVTYIQKNIPNYSWIGVGRENGDIEGEFVAIYYNTAKYKLLEHETFWLSENPDTISIGWDSALKRICTYGKFINKQTKKVIHIFNTHFDHQGIEAQKMSAKLILKKINTKNLDNSNVIVMGDFNCEPQSKPIKILKTKLTDGMAISKEKFYGPKGTLNGFNTNLPNEKRIDYIFTKNLIVNFYKHICDKRANNSWFSDHLPVLIEVVK